MHSQSDLPGFYRDPKTGRYFSIPTNPCTYIPDFHTKVNNQEQDEVSFNRLPLCTNKSAEHLKGRKTNAILDTLVCYQNGSITKNNFEMQVKKLKLRSLSKVNPHSLYPGVVCWMDDIDMPCTCKQVLSHGNMYIGVWTRWGIASINKITKIYKRRKCKGSAIYELGDIEIGCIATFRKRVVNHLSLAQFSDRKFSMLCAADTYNKFTSQFILTSFDDVRIHNLYPIYKGSSKELYRTCTSSDEAKLIALGMSKGFDILSLTSDSLRSILPKSIFPTRYKQEDHRALEFLSSGNVIFCAVSYGKLVSYDIRMQNILKLAELNRGVEYMKILNNDWTLIASSYDNKLLNVDLRMNKIVFEYPGHVNKHRKILFTYDENIDILCSPGQDNVTRFWSLKLGEPLASLKPPIETEDQIHSVFTYEEHALCTSVFFDKRMNCYEPFCI